MIVYTGNVALRKNAVVENILGFEEIIIPHSWQ